MTDMEKQLIIAQMQNDITSGKIKCISKDGYRVYTDGNKEVIITTKEETIENYYNTFIASTVANAPGTTPFDEMPRCNIYVGQPDTGKTYQAQKLAEDYGVESLLIMARDNLNLETLLEDFTLVNGQPVFQESLAIKMLSGTEKGIIIIDEFNTLLTGVMKTLQPLLDTTSKTFEYKGKVYTKNLNCKFILTLNDKDKGISVIPDAILSRSNIVYFETPSDDVLAQWTNTSSRYVQEVRSLYSTLGILHLFGSRQINILKQLKTADNIANHLKGVCSLRGTLDDKLMESLEFKNTLATLCKI